MKNAKLIFTALSVFAIVGSALAVKSSKLGSFLLYKQVVSGGACILQDGTWTTGGTLQINAVSRPLTSNPAASLPASDCTNQNINATQE